MAPAVPGAPVLMPPSLGRFVHPCHAILSPPARSILSSYRRGTCSFIVGLQPQREMSGLFMLGSRHSSSVSGTRGGRGAACQRQLGAAGQDSKAETAAHRLVHGQKDLINGDRAVAALIPETAAQDRTLAQCDVDHRQDLIHRHLAVAIAVADTPRRGRGGRGGGSGRGGCGLRCRRYRGRCCRGGIGGGCGRRRARRWR